MNSINEMTVIAKSTTELVEKKFYELNELQLALIGGGVGETVLS